MDFEAQAKHIEELTQKYYVEYIGIDATTVGQGVFQLVCQFFPAARKIKYTPEIKTAMVLKAKHTINNGRLEYDTGHTDITQSFIAIRKTMTASGKSSTYVASRSEETSHADVAWAIMHALLNEPLTATYGGHSPNILEFYGMSKRKGRKALSRPVTNHTASQPLCHSEPRLTFDLKCPV